MSYPVTETTPITYNGPPPPEADVVVIGGGVIGVCTALFLARAGQKVVLCEKGRIAGEQSSRNWGWIRTQGRDPDEVPIMAEAARIWQSFAAETNVDIGLRQVGVSYLAKSDEDLERFRNWLPTARQNGLDTQVLTRREVAAMAPGLSKSYFGAMHTASDMRAAPGVAVPALAGIAAREGAILVENCAVRTVETTAAEVSAVITEDGAINTTRVVVAGGAWSSLFLRRHGVNIPQLSVTASVCATKPLPDIGSHAAGPGDGLAWVRRDDGGYTIAASGFHEFFPGPDAFRALRSFIPHLKEEFASTRFLPLAPKGFPDHWMTARKWGADDVTPFEKMRVLNPRPNMGKLRAAISMFEELFPNLGPVRMAKAWGGMIDTTPDFVPIVDEAPQINGLFVGTGMTGHGFGIGPGFGRVLADLVLGKDPGHDLNRFRISRFTDGSPLRLGPR
ncbi:MAG: FAD-binding oxidoreductase [Pseudomonadota bacterium]